MKFKILLFTFINLTIIGIKAQSTDDMAVAEVLNNYINGSSFNNAEQLQSAFSNNATLYLTLRDGEKRLSSDEYVAFYKDKEKGSFSGRIGNILSIAIDNDIATAQVEIVIPEADLIFTDLFLLKNIESQWKIVSKTATKKKQEHHGRILFIVSNADFYKGTTIKTGTSFSEIVLAYDTFIKAGYYVDFVSPEGGAISSVYYAKNDTIQKAYYENQPFMNRLKYTKKPTEVNPSSYNAVYYVGGGAAMFDVPENKEIQAIAMSIYEKQNGIISAVCHGTAGIVNLKTKDENYLVANKEISGWPEAYENVEKPYFTSFPFLIGETIEKHGGTFTYGKRDDIHYVVDGRVITGQSNLTSAAVAHEVVSYLEKNKKE
ncbi:nuclear transport factor 2 family protein [Aquimarina sp. ERC-38]|uniref:nuclear transport factor 2 family protein n=1 Tax=Aquimarina sp. ERC-38 TaxID=2949996 RepID=UPI002246A00F|nr:nuclear transport factor 2 family protein [Aquimarina sp. ERC-38]UZO79842.1 nuclear transport factor 2 family protein [Aquimarina sp. ERC-38]